MLLGKETQGPKIRVSERAWPFHGSPGCSTKGNLRASFLNRERFPWSSACFKDGSHLGPSLGKGV